MLFLRRLARKEFEEPRDPDQQKKEMLAITEEEHYRFIPPEALRKIDYYLEVVRTLPILALP